MRTVNRRSDGRKVTGEDGMGCISCNERRRRVRFWACWNSLGKELSLRSRKIVFEVIPEPLFWKGSIEYFSFRL